MIKLRQHDIDISSGCRRQWNSPFVWKNNQKEEDTTLCSENNFLRSYWILMVDEQTKGCDLSKGDSLCCQKRIYIYRPLLGVFFIFLSFSIFLKSLKNNKIILRYKGGTRVTSILVPSARNILILIARIHVQEKDTRGKFLHGSRCQDAKAKLYKA